MASDYSDRNPPPSNRQLLVLLGIFLGLILVGIWLLNWLLNHIIGLIPPSVEQRLGAPIVAAYERQAQPSPAQDTLNQLLDRLEAELPDGRDYRALLVPEPTVNALALPGDAIIIYGGLIEQAESENELMMVLGHELGHFAHRDHLRRIGRVLLVRMVVATVLGDVGALQSIASSAITAVSQSRFSQSQEREADEFGLTLLNATYGHVAGATDFFERLSQQRKADFAFLSTHPAPKQRITALKRLIETRDYPIKERKPLPETLSNLQYSRTFRIPSGAVPLTSGSEFPTRHCQNPKSKIQNPKWYKGPENYGCFFPATRSPSPLAQRLYDPLFAKYD
jgi:predicted Zn-dependent protease